VCKMSKHHPTDAESAEAMLGLAEVFRSGTAEETGVRWAGTRRTRELVRGRRQFHSLLNAPMSGRSAQAHSVE
jgi:hypothetical protein